MYKSDFYYDLPPELIAQSPAKERDGSRLLRLSRETGEIIHGSFKALPDCLRPGDCLIINDTRVIPARLYGRREDSGTQVEFLLLSQKSGNIWEALAGPGKRARPGHRFVFSPELSGEVLEILEGGNRLVRFFYTGIFTEILDRVGEMPLPHYITEKLTEKERYQTVYAAHDGSAAAPTAGLHFTEEMLTSLRSGGIEVGNITLHVGLGTFRPVKEEVVENHKMHSEFYHIPEETADLINRTKARGGRVICVGTTSCRALESAAARGGISEYSGETDIFITPGYRFRVMDGLITNFHLPESTLIMLVSAFGGYDNVMAAYSEAVRERYRFFSFGDAMMIL